MNARCCNQHRLALTLGNLKLQTMLMQIYSTWISHVCHIHTPWVSHAYYVKQMHSTQISHVCHMHTTWMSHAYYVDANAQHMNITCVSHAPLGCHMHTMLSKCTAHKYHMCVTCTPLGYHMHTMLVPHVQHIGITCIYYIVIKCDLSQ